MEATMTRDEWIKAAAAIYLDEYACFENKPVEATAAATELAVSYFDDKDARYSPEDAVSEDATYWEPSDE